MKKSVVVTLNFSRWAKWVAVDRDGCIVEHQNKPSCLNGIFVSNGKYGIIGHFNNFPPDWNWKDTLRELKNYG